MGIWSFLDNRGYYSGTWCPIMAKLCMTSTFQSRSESRVRVVRPFVCACVCNAISFQSSTNSSVKIKHQNEASNSSIKIKRQNQESKSSAKIKFQNQASQSSVKINSQNEASSIILNIASRLSSIKCCNPPSSPHK